MKRQTFIICLLLSASLSGYAQVAFPTPAIVNTPTPVPSVTPNPSPSPDHTPYIFSATPTPSISPATPTPAEIPTHYQPPSGHPLYPTKLEWRIFSPSGTGPWPAVIILHIGEFKGGGYYDGQPTRIAQQFADAGFYAAVASYPLAPPNLITGQPDHSNTSSGRPPEQTDSVKALIGAMRADLVHCDGNVGVLGGSAGGGHAAFVAIDQTNTGNDWPFWNGEARPNFVASLSGVYDLSDRTDVAQNTSFVRSCENYTNSATPSYQWQNSAVGQLTTSNADIKPIYAISSEEDSMPASQQWDLFNAFYQKGVSSTLYKMWIIPNDPLHAFSYWDDPILDTAPMSAGWLVEHRVMGYFQYFLQQQGHSHF